MIQRVYDKALKVKCKKTLVATDDKRILQHCKLNNIDCVMTKKVITGSDRVSEVSRKYNTPWILNLQGDEPIINVNDIKNLIKKTFSHNKKIKIFLSPLYILKKETNEENPNEARLLLNNKNEVIIFTRKKITLGLKKNFI